MTFLEATTTDALRAAIASSPAAQAGADQIEAENGDALRIAPGNRHFAKIPALAAIIRHAIARLEDSAEPTGIAPVITVASGHAADSRMRERAGNAPSRFTAAVRYCHECGDATNRTVPFWFAVTRYVVQIDLCPLCADRQVCDFGATIQVA